MTATHRLPRTARLNDDKIIASFRSAARRRGRWFLVRSSANDAGSARLVIRVAKRVIRTSVGRNRIKRCVREVFRRQRPELASCDFLISVIERYTERSLGAARDELEQLLLRPSGK